VLSLKTGSLKMAKHMIQKSAYRRIGTSTFMPHSRHIMPLHREITEQRNKLFVAYPGRRHKIRGHTIPAPATMAAMTASLVSAMIVDDGTMSISRSRRETASEKLPCILITQINRRMPG
jgi:hypothetical protein